MNYLDKLLELDLQKQSEPIFKSQLQLMSSSLSIPTRKSKIKSIAYEMVDADVKMKTLIWLVAKIKIDVTMENGFILNVLI